MAIELPPLPYADDALDPHISARDASASTTASTTPTYVANLNGLIEGTPNADKSLEEIIADAEPGGLFNNAAQVWNHTFYWNSMAPSGGGEPSGDLAAAIDASFGSRQRLQAAARRRRPRATSARAGPGSSRTATAWPSSNTDDADTPIKHGKTPLLTVDVWEHAYYLDYQNARPAYLETFVDKLLNWEFAAANFAPERDAWHRAHRLPSPPASVAGRASVRRA